MIVRLVKMTFTSDKITDFLNLFDSVKDRILGFPGCQKLILFRDIKDSTVIFTYSEWNSEEDLNNYRNSLLFKTTWDSVKPLFAVRAEAWSMAETAEMF